MISVLKRHEIKALIQAGMRQAEVARWTDVSLSTVKRVAKEPDLRLLDDAAERKRRGIGRPGVTETFRKFVVTLLKQKLEFKAVDVLRCARLEGYAGGKSTMYALVASVRRELADSAMAHVSGNSGLLTSTSGE